MAATQGRYDYQHDSRGDDSAVVGVWERCPVHFSNPIMPANRRLR